MVGLLLILALSCFAQSEQRLPDSISTSDSSFPAVDSNVEPQAEATDSLAATSKSILADTAMLRPVPGTVVDGIKNDPDFAYANDPAYWSREPVNRQRNFLDRLFGLAGSRWLRWFWYLLLGSVLLFALYKIVVENKLYLFYASAKNKEAETLPETDLFSEDLEEKISNAVESGDFRSGTRYLFLKALKKADERQWIHFRARATNEDYVREFSNQLQAANFRFLTNVYEHVWYGGFGLTAQQFGAMRQHFENFYHFEKP
jgi:hypothetical protein